MKTLILLVMHGVPPEDFPVSELREFFRLHAFAGGGARDGRDFPERRYRELEKKIRAWPRTPANDPFWAASRELADRLGAHAGMEVVLGYSEFCSPDLYEAFEDAVLRGAERIVVVTTIMTAGGEHAERNIPEAIARARRKHPGVRIDYAWPFPREEIAAFLAGQIERIGE